MMTVDPFRKVSDLVDKYERHDLTVWGNRKSVTTEACYLSNPKIGLLFSLKRVLVVIALFYTGLLPFVSFKETHFEVPMPTMKGKRKNGKVSWAAVVMDKILMRRALFEHLKRRGIEVFLWVLNDDEEFERACNMGASGIMTDYPQKLTSFLGKREFA